MPQEQKLTGFIIKTQDLGEADVLLTFFSKDNGKQRVLVKSAKKMSSRLSGRLQPSAEIEITLVGNNSLAKVIGVETISQYQAVLVSGTHIHALLAMQELVLRSLADEQANLVLYTLYQDTMGALAAASDEDVIFIITGFFVKATSALGFAPESKLSAEAGATDGLYFSIQNGKWELASSHSDDWHMDRSAYDLYNRLLLTWPDEWESFAHKDATKLLAVINHFVGYQLERQLRAAEYFLVV